MHRLFLGLLTMFFSASASADDAALTVNVHGIQNDQGKVRVVLYSDAKHFRMEKYAISVIEASAVAGTLVMHFDKVKPGVYAVVAYHDEDGNNELNRRLGMFPTEGYGLSNNPIVSGPPAFEPSAFEVRGPMQINIELRY
jgi:uncharacterized protein (DUF2141 family)